MSRLPPRKYCPLDVRCRVALRQLGTTDIENVLAANVPDRTVAPQYRKSFQKLLAQSLLELAFQFGCEVRDLRRDHNPALALRKQVWKRGDFVDYDPPENDPDAMEYRPHGAQFAGSHDVKTRIRGDHGQYSDITLIKRERRRERKKNAKDKPKPRWPKGRKLWSRNTLRKRR